MPGLRGAPKLTFPALLCTASHVCRGCPWPHSAPRGGMLSALREPP